MPDKILKRVVSLQKLIQRKALDKANNQKETNPALLPKARRQAKVL